MRWEDVAYVKDSPLSKKILECLAASNRPLTPIEMAKKTNIASSNISTKLRGLRERKLAICINPETKKSRFYMITKRGKEALKQHEKLYK